MWGESRSTSKSAPVPHTLQPHSWQVLLGVVLGATPLSALFLGLGAPFAPIMDAAKLLGSATLAVQTLVLASSLAASLPESDGERGPEDDRERELHATTLWRVAGVRLLLMPLVGLALNKVAVHPLLSPTRSLGLPLQHCRVAAAISTVFCPPCGPHLLPSAAGESSAPLYPVYLAPVVGCWMNE